MMMEYIIAISFVVFQMSLLFIYYRHLKSMVKAKEMYYLIDRISKDYKGSSKYDAGPIGDECR